ncbi:MAG: glycoside hydrolase family 97 protein [Bacteroidales bacterium]|nr:glycoside hydrolase family 97 protein [Bacteroidales bacterium]
MRIFLLCAAITFALTIPVQAKSYELASPSGKLKLQIEAAQNTSFSLSVNGKPALENCSLALMLSDGSTLGRDVRVIKARTGRVKDSMDALCYRQSRIESEYNYLTLKLRGNYSLEFRAYDDGVAYRFASSLKDSLTIMDELVEYRFADNFDMLVPYIRPGRSDKYESSFESQYTAHKAGETPCRRFAFMPVYVSLGSDGCLLLMESDIRDYPGIYLQATDYGFKACFTPVGETFKTTSRGVRRSASYCEHIAHTSGTRSFPWRVIAYGDDEKALSVNDMVYKLAEPCKIEDTSWIKPGQAVWDWWSHFTLYGVPFKSGINMDYYKFNIDFASRYGIPYVVLDEGWYKKPVTDLFNVVDNLDIRELSSYALSKGVKLVLWASSGLFDKDLEKVCSHYSELGVGGFKVDFFDAQDQYTLAQIERFASTAAKYHLVLDFHGIFKPFGLSRTWPNILNYEGVYGLEQVKWTDGKVLDHPRYDVSIPFIRMASGPMDYTPGALRNAPRSAYRPVNARPMSQGTRAHQVALYVCLDSPFTMLCDSPSDYLAEDATTRFITSIPTVFDRTLPLGGKVEESFVTARCKDGKWYVGGITSWTPRDIEVSFDFLPEGNWTATVYRDGVNADTVGSDYVIESFDVRNTDKHSFHLAPGGGFALILTK